MDQSAENRRLVRIRRSALTSIKLHEIEKPHINISKHFSDLHNAFQLIYTQYQEQGYINAPHPQKILYNIYNFLPETCLFTFSSSRKIVSTISLIPDTDLFMLPMDTLYHEELNKLRIQGRKVAEIGQLACDKCMRSKNIVMYLFKAAINYGIATNINSLCMMLNPKHARFYKEVMLCEQIGEEKHYDAVGAPAVAMHLNLDNYRQRLLDTYGSADLDTNLFNFFLQNYHSVVDQCILSFNEECCETVEQDAANFFFRQRPEIISNLTPDQYAYIEEIYQEAISCEYDKECSNYV